MPEDRSTSPVLRRGDRSAAVPELRARLARLELADLDEGSDVYDAALERAVRAFQQQRGLTADGIIGSWLGVGLCLVLFLSGVANIQPELFEAARMDGAGAVGEFFAITLPALRGQIAVALTLTVVAALKTFDLVYITTRGGPGTSTTLPAFEAYNRAFNTGQVGSAASVAILLTLLILVITMLIQRIQPDEVA